MRKLAPTAVMLAALLALLLGACGEGEETSEATDASTVSDPVELPGDCSGEQWVSTWSTSLTDVQDGPGEGATFRAVVSPHFGGQTARFRFSNALSDEPLEIGAASVAPAGDGAATDGEPAALAFDGEAGVTISPGETRFSDPVDVGVQSFEHLAISGYLPEAATLVRHVVALQDQWVTPAGGGDLTGESSGEGFETLPSYLVVDRAEVRANSAARELVVFGDSLTDGYGTEQNADSRLPDQLQRLLAEERPDIAVVNSGIGGNRLLADSAAGQGASADERLKPDVLGIPDARDVIIEEGLNDVAGGAAADDVIAALEQLAGRSEEAGLQPLLATLTPTARLDPAAEQARQDVNAWIRDESGYEVVDFDSAVADPDDETVLDPAFDSGDGLHPNADGYAALAATVDPGSLSAPDCERSR